MVLMNKKQNDEYVNYVYDVITRNWLASQLRMVYRGNNQFKELGSEYGLYHPFIIDYLDHLYLLRRAEMRDELDMLLGNGYINIIELGKNLFELREEYDIKNIRSRLQSKENFNDTCWELEVMQALKCSRVQAQINEEGNGKQFDILAKINQRQVAIECKNKHIVDEDYRQNQMFIEVFVWKLIKLLEEKRGRHDVRVSIEGVGKIEDIPIIIKTVKYMLENKIPIRRCKDKYRIWFLDDYKGIGTADILQISNETFCIEARQFNNLKEAYKSNDISDGNYKDRVFFRCKTENVELKNVDALIKKANTQINKNPGCVFLKVPYFAFDDAVNKIIGLFKGSFGNISAVKIVALNKTFLQQQGVKVEWKEKLIENNYATLRLPDEFVSILSNDMFFKKYINEN